MLKPRSSRLWLLMALAIPGCLASHASQNHRSPRGGSAEAGLACSQAQLLQSACGLQAADLQAEPAVRPLSNAEYLSTVRDLLPGAAIAGITLPPESVGAGFDTSPSAHNLSPTVAQVFLTTGQQFASAYVASTTDCVAAKFDPSCTGPALAAFAEKAYRRPLLDGEKQRLSALPATLIQAGNAPKDAYASAMAAVLLTPQFLYRARLSGQSGVAHADQYALASSLSYALWSTMPDQTTLDLAKGGQYAGSSVAEDVNRMLNEPKSVNFLQNFAGQWLGLQSLAQAPAAGALATEVVQDMTLETQQFLGDFLKQNTNIKHLLDAPFTYANSRLALLYGLPAMAQPTPLTRVTLTGPERAGLLTQGSFLLQTSSPDRTAPVKRGKWIMDNILCSSPPPPPSDQAGSLGATDTTLPVRQRLAKHRASPACAGCHTTMDPMGLAFENYDHGGRWRASDAFGPIDAGDTLADGTIFKNAHDLTLQLKENPAFPRCMATKLATYALGRAPNEKEVCVINKIAAKTQDESYGLRNMLVDLTLTLLAR